MRGCSRSWICCGPSSGAVTARHGPSRIDRSGFGVGHDGRDSGDHVSCKGIGHRAHAADWDIPVPHVIRALQHKDPAASPGQIGRAGQPVVPGPHKAVVIVIDALADEGNG